MMKHIIFWMVIGCLPISCAMSPAFPTFKQLWDAADIVVVATVSQVEPLSSQEDLPSDMGFGLEYQRVLIQFDVREVLKGAFTKEEIALRKETQDDENMLEFSTITATRTGEVKHGGNPAVPPHPFVTIAKHDYYLLYLRRGLYGQIEPVDPVFFASIIKSGFELY